MRLVLVSQEYPPETGHGGIGTQTSLKAHGLTALGHDVIVISHSTDADRHERADCGVRVIRIPGFDPHLSVASEPVRWLTYSALVASEIEAIHARTPIDLLDFPEWGGEGYIHLVNRTDWNHIPVVVHIHGPLAMLAGTIGWPARGSDLERIGREMEGTSLRLADAVLASSEQSAGWCAREYGLGPDRIPILHLGVDTRRFRPQRVPKSPRPTVIFVGKVAANKGADVLARAAAFLARSYPDLRLRLIGPVSERFAEELRAVCSSGTLELVGFVPPDRLPEELSRAHVFAAPAPHEGGPGLVYLEAMACGLPVVACEGSGAAEVVRPDQNGLLVPPGDASALAEAIGALLSDESRRRELGRRARAWTEAEADTRDRVRRLEAFYTAVAEGRDPAAAGLAAAERTAT